MGAEKEGWDKCDRQEESVTKPHILTIHTAEVAGLQLPNRPVIFNAWRSPPNFPVSIAGIAKFSVSTVDGCEDFVGHALEHGHAVHGAGLDGRTRHAVDHA